MSRLAALAAWICVGLWLGGIVFLFIAVTTLFHTFPKRTSDVAIEAAPRLFMVFEKYELMLGVCSLLCTFAWYVRTRSRLVMTAFILLALAAAGAAISTTLVSAKMHALREAGQSGSPQFMTLHARSMIIYMSQALLLLAVAIMLSFGPLAPPRIARIADPD